MEPEIPFPSPLPVMPPPTTALSHPGGVFPGREGSLGVQGRPWLCLGNSPHFLTSHTTWRPNLATPHSPGPVPGPLTQPATSPKGPHSAHQRDTPKAFPLLGEASQAWGGVRVPPGEVWSCLSPIICRQTKRSGDPVTHNERERTPGRAAAETLPAAPAPGPTVPAHVTDHRREEADAQQESERQHPTLWGED